MPDTLLQRYSSGEYIEVWNDLVSLGRAVRHELYRDDAAAVASETMRRARHNVEALIVKLDKLGYRFSNEEFEDESETGSAMFSGQVVPFNSQDAVAMLSTELERITQPGYAFRNPLEEMMAANASRWQSTLLQATSLQAKAEEEASARRQKASAIQDSRSNPEVFKPATRSTEKALELFERQLGGPLPLSLYHWYLHVGSVNLNGWHEALRPADGSADSAPLRIEGFWEYAQVFDPGEQEEEGKYILEVAPEATFELPEPVADTRFRGCGMSNVTFVEYLRKTFAWGGFPGFARLKANLPKEVTYLKDGLLPL